MSNYFNDLFGNKTFFVAEIGGNFSDYNTGIKLIDLAIDSGADAVKIQTYKAFTLASKKAMFSSDGMKFTGDVSQYESFEQYQIDDEVQKRLFEYAKSNNILLFSTPSHFSDCIVLEELNCPIYKIGSDDVTNIPFLKEVAGIGKPIILSTGMSTLEEVREAVDEILHEGNNDICLLHCVTNYPADYDSANLLSIKTMIDEFKPIPIGFSDHSPYDELVIAAVALGARIIEKHLTYDKNASGPDHPISLLPQEFRNMVEKIREIEIALGDGIKKPAKTESITRKNNRKSIVMTKSLKAGEIITKESFGIKRPGYGIEPKYVATLIGKVLVKDVEEDDTLSWDYFRQ
jgi:N,N'-diacetyllegionaminate synthase